MMEGLAIAAAVLGLLPVVLYLWNSQLFRRAPLPPPRCYPRVSVLIPARNEEASIAACVQSVLNSLHVDLEVIVLDDHSEDRTADVVRGFTGPRVRLEAAPPLQDGWNGKQHACCILSTLATHSHFVFLDADVRLEPFALARSLRFLEESRAGLVSGFPRQETVTLLERLLLPLINWLLLSYLPLIGMRHSRWSAFAAGCGQFFLCTRAAYEKSGGHAAIRHSMHDGVTLPRAFRRAGIHTDIFDASDLATCRMYRSNRATWNGLAKNAHEGLGHPLSIIPWTILLLGSLTCPFWLLPRLLGARRYRESLLSAFAHPLGVSLLLAIQWYALLRRAMGRPIGWKGRANPPK